MYVGSLYNMFIRRASDSDLQTEYSVTVLYQPPALTGTWSCVDNRSRSLAQTRTVMALKVINLICVWSYMAMHQQTPGQCSLSLLLLLSSRYRAPWIEIGN